MCAHTALAHPPHLNADGEHEHGDGVAAHQAAQTLGAERDAPQQPEGAWAQRHNTGSKRTMAAVNKKGTTWGSREWERVVTSPPPPPPCGGGEVAMKTRAPTAHSTPQTTPIRLPTHSHQAPHIPQHTQCTVRPRPRHARWGSRVRRALHNGRTLHNRGWQGSGHPPPPHPQAGGTDTHPWAV